MTRKDRQINGSTKICMVIGDPISHSLSPFLHNAAYEIMGLSEKFVFVAAHVPPKGLREAIRGIRALNIRGVSVTLPHKSAIIPLLNEVDPLAAKINSANTIVNDEDCLKGYNTDVEGIIAPLEERTTLTGKRVALLGAGGTARSAAYALQAKKCRVKIFNRTRDHAKKLGTELDLPWSGLDTLDALSDFDIVIHSTSVGMTPQVDKSLIPKMLFRPDQIVFDLVYTPLDTKLLKDAQAQRAETIRGIEMFLYQAAAQIKLYTGHNAPLEEMRALLSKHFGARGLASQNGAKS